MLRRLLLLLLGVLHRSLDNPFRQAFAAQLASNEKAGQRPYFFRKFADVGWTTKVTVSCSRSDGAPSNGLPAGVAQQPDWDAFANVSFHRRFPVWTLRGFCPGSPDHAPAGFWSTATLEQALKIIPTGSVNFVKRDMLHVAHDSDVSHSTQWRGYGSPAVCQFTSELADASDFRVTIEPKPKNGSRLKSQVMADKAVTATREQIGRFGNQDMARLGIALAACGLAMLQSGRRTVQSASCCRRLEAAFSDTRQRYRAKSYSGAAPAGLEPATWSLPMM